MPRIDETNPRGGAPEKPSAWPGGEAFGDAIDPSMLRGPYGDGPYPSDEALLDAHFSNDPAGGFDSGEQPVTADVYAPPEVFGIDPEPDTPDDDPQDDERRTMAGVYAPPEFFGAQAQGGPGDEAPYPFNYGEGFAPDRITCEDYAPPEFFGFQPDPGDETGGEKPALREDAPAPGGVGDHRPAPGKRFLEWLRRQRKD